MHFVAFLILGGLTAIVGRRFMVGQGYGLVPDTILGILGGVVGGWLSTLLFGTAAVAIAISLVVAVGAAAILIAVVHSVKSEPVRT